MAITYIKKFGLHALVGEELDLEREHGNSYDRYATTVKKGAVVVGRVPRELSKDFLVFLSWRRRN